MATTNWQLDPAHSELNFRVRHLVIATVSGKFDRFTSSISTEGDDFNTAQIAFDAETASVNTGVDARDNHLRSDDFFNCEKFPLLRFQSTALKQLNGDQYQLDGTLTIRDVSRPISLQVEFGGIAKDPYGNIKAAFEVNGVIKRKEFGLLWDAFTETGGAVVSDEVKIHANVQFAKVQA